MPDLSEFITFIAEKSGVKKPSLIEKDVMLHKILRDIYSSHLATNYLFKGGTCLVKCYLGYYRFSADLDLTWKDQKIWEGLSRKELRRRLLAEVDKFGSLLEKTAEELALDFSNDPKNRKYIEFGGDGKMVTFKLWKGSELIKVQVNFVERILFKPRKIEAKTLLSGELTEDEKAYFDEWLEFYRPLQVSAYDEREILCEKVRAILTRRGQKLRDFYDVFMLDEHGVKIEELKEGAVEKIRAALQYRKYRENLEKNRELLVGKGIMEDPFERDFFVVKPPRKFERFFNDWVRELRSIADIV